VLKKIGNRIRKIRLAKGLTLANMGEELEMTTSAYAKIERGETNMPASRLIQIAAALDVNVSQLFEDPVPLAVEGKNSYGYATKEEVWQLNQMFQKVLKELEALRGELPVKKRKIKKKTAAKK